jgi:hypothetical protein
MDDDVKTVGLDEKIQNKNRKVKQAKRIQLSFFLKEQKNTQISETDFDVRIIDRKYLKVSMVDGFFDGQFSALKTANLCSTS